LKLEGLYLNPLVQSGNGLPVSIPDTVQNLLLFAPFGVLGVLAGRPGARSWSRVIGVTVLGGLLSLLVEVLQLFEAGRTTAVSDLFTNTVGTFVGALVAQRVIGVSRSLLRRLLDAGLISDRAFYPLLVALITVSIAAWEPFDVTLDVSTVGTKLHALGRDVLQAGVPTDEGVAVLQYALFTVAGASWLKRTGWRRPALAAALAGAVLALVLEASQVVITSRMPSGEDALVHAAGALAGAALWIAGRRSPRPALWIALVALATAVGAGMLMFTPFQWADAHLPFRWMPFLGYYQHTTFETVSHVVELVLLYFPLGFCVGHVMQSPNRAALAVLALVVAMAIPIEYLQGWFVGRIPDVTDTALSAAGGWFGVWAATRGAAVFDELCTALRAPARRDDQTR
jgi:VanZ family protein